MDDDACQKRARHLLRASEQAATSEAIVAALVAEGALPNQAKEAYARAVLAKLDSDRRRPWILLAIVAAVLLLGVGVGLWVLANSHVSAVTIIAVGLALLTIVRAIRRA